MEKLSDALIACVQPDHKNRTTHPRKGRTTLSECKPRLLKTRSKTSVFLYAGFEGTQQEAKKTPKIIPCSGTGTGTASNKLNNKHSVIIVLTIRFQMIITSSY